MPGVVKSRFIQLGRETVAGTEVDATTLYRGSATWTDETEVTFVEENVGYLSGVDRTYIAKKSSLAEFDDHEATFEQILYWLDGGIDGAITGTNSGSGYIYTYVMPEQATDSQTPATYTIEMGDSQAEEQAVGCIVEEFTISGAPDEPLKISGSWRGQQLAAGTRTAGLSGTLPTVEEIMFNKGKLYISTGATYGSQLTGTWVGFNLNVKTGWVYYSTGDGNLYPTNRKNVGSEVTCEITFEHDANTVAERAAFRAQTHRNVHMIFEGNALTTPGSYTYKTLIINLQGKYEDFSGFDDQDGDNVVTGTLRCRYNDTSKKFVDFVVVNETASLTPSASTSPSGSTSPSTSVSPSLSPSESLSPSGSTSPSPST